MSMKVSPVWLFVAIPTLVGNAAAQSPAEAHSTQGSSATRQALSMSIEPVQAVVSAGSPVELRVTLANTSDHDIVIEEDMNSVAVWMAYRVEVRYENGSMAPHTELGRRQYQGRGTGAVHRFEDDVTPDAAMMRFTVIGVPMKAGESVPGLLNVSRLYDLSKPGKYTIQVSRGAEEGVNATVKSNTVTVTVTPAAK